MRTIYYHVLVLLAALLFLPSLEAQETAFARQDSLALVALYRATDGENWSTPWPLSEPIEEWAGVSRSPNGRIIQLNLGGQGLRGRLPETLTDLHQLAVLDLSGNRLNGRLTPFWDFQNLIVLNLSGNIFSDTLSQEIGRLRNLRQLDLSNNKLYGELPDALFQLRALQRLGLGKNQFLGRIPTGLGQLRQLTYLDVAHNQFSGRLPEVIRHLTGLRTLLLNNNRFGGGLRPEWERLGNLHTLNLSANRLRGAIPESWQQLRQVTYAYLNNNQLDTGIVRLLNHWRNLKELHAQNNHFSDRLSSWRNRIAPLEVLNLSNNRLKGTLPAAFRHLRKLRYLNLSGNTLEGELLMDVFTIGTLRYLNLSHNQFVGTIPETVVNLVSIETFDVSHNQLSGDLSEWSFVRLQALRSLNLSHNQFGPVVPPRVREARQLQHLDLSHNAFAEDLSELSRMEALTSLDISHNAFTNTLPETLGTNRKLQQLQLGNNAFTGAIPETWSALTQLRQLRAAHNQLRDISALQTLYGLKSLHLSHNQIQELPVFADSLFDLDQLFVEHNRLTFEDLEENLNAAKDFRYSPQQSPPTVGVCTLAPGTGGRYNRYQWFQDSVTVTEGTDSLFVVREVGTYFCQITNDSLPDLTLVSEPLYTEETTPETYFPAADTSFCFPFRLVLDAGAGDRYEWNTGDSLRRLEVTRADTFAVRTFRGQCSQQDTIRVQFYGARNNTMPAGQAICAGQVPQKLIAGASDSTHTYFWEASEDLQSWTRLAETQSYQPDALTQTTYFRRWVVTDSCGAQVSDTLSVFVSQLRLRDTIRDATCFGAPDGALAILPEAGLAPFRVRWADGDSSYIRQNLSAGTYAVNVQDSAGCSVTRTLRISEPDEIQVDYQVVRPSCDPEVRDGSIQIAISGGTPPYRIRWNVPRSQHGRRIDGLAAGKYRVWITDSLGCQKSQEILLRRADPPNAGFRYVKDHFCQFEDDPLPLGQIDAGGTFSAQPWGMVLDEETGQIDLKRTRPGTYEVLLRFPRCASRVFTVKISPDCLNQIPNAFTPNGDGVNDTWEIPLLARFPGAVVEVFDRFGSKIYASAPGYPEPWKGQVATGIYFYRIRFADGKKKVGRVSVIR